MTGHGKRLLPFHKKYAKPHVLVRGLALFSSFIFLTPEPLYLSALAFLFNTIAMPAPEISNTARYNPSGVSSPVLGVADGFSVCFTAGFSVGCSVGFSVGFSVDFSVGFSVGFLLEPL